jgi:hypothetical protein
MGAASVPSSSTSKGVARARRKSSASVIAMSSTTTPARSTSGVELPDALIGAVRSTLGPIDDDMLRAVAVIDIHDETLTRRNGAVRKSLSCTRKMAMGRKAARKAARTLSQRTGEELRAYPCGFCRRYHVGHGSELPEVTVVAATPPPAAQVASGCPAATEPSRPYGAAAWVAELLTAGVVA